MYMNITLFGSTGHVGQLFMQQALAAGHTVTAYARNPKKITIESPNIRIVTGELTDADAIALAIDGADVVVSTMGPNGYQDKLIFAPAYEHIVAGMELHGVRRIIALGTPTTHDPNDRWNPVFWALILIVSFIIGRGSEDILLSANIVRTSGLDWTLVRVPLLRNAPARGHVTIGAFGRGIWWPFITRADFVDFLVKQLTDRTYSGQAPAISN
jgi:uncharacterized protein YbjT (DUF2867 family)